MTRAAIHENGGPRRRVETRAPRGKQETLVLGARDGSFNQRTMGRRSQLHAFPRLRSSMSSLLR